MSRPDLLVVLGPTASGKTRFAAHLAAALHAEVISADSRQVFRGMDLGTGKDLHEYTVNGVQVPYHLIDIVDAGADYHLYRYQQDFFEVYDQIRMRHRLPVLCGGSGLYMESVLKGHAFVSVPVNDMLRNDLKGKTHGELTALFRSLPPTPYTQLADLSTAKRTARAIEICMYLKDHEWTGKANPALSALIFGLDPGLELRRKRIEERLRWRLAHGLVEEVQALLQKGLSAEKLIFYGLEYKFVVQYIQGELTYEEMQSRLTVAIQQFAKRQMTFFRKMERDGFTIHWIDASLPLEEQLSLLRPFLQDLI